MIVNANSISIPLEDKVVHCTMTSPPFWGLRDYNLPPTEWPSVTYTPMAGLAPVTVQGCDPGCAHEWGPQMIGKTAGGGGNAGMAQRRDAYDAEVRGIHVSAKRIETAKLEGQGGKSVSQGSYCQLCGGWRGCLGLEPTPEMFVGHIVAVFREVWRVLRDDGTLWLNFGDSYASASACDRRNVVGQGSPDKSCRRPNRLGGVLKEKDLCGIPWRVAFALQADGWFLRNDIIWHKPNPMPESVTDRCTKSHEYLFLLSKRKRYFYDAQAVREDGPTYTRKAGGYTRQDIEGEFKTRGGFAKNDTTTVGRNRRTVWTIPTRGYSGAHFATFPPALVTPCILAGTSAKGVCPHCGKPWVRVVEKERVATRPGRISSTDFTAPHLQSRGSGGNTELRYRYETSISTIGWRPACECSGLVIIGNQPVKPPDGDSLQSIADFTMWQVRMDKWWQHWRSLKPEYDAEPRVPAIVLDPFCGSGTVGEVCKPHGRKFVGLDLSSSYLRTLALPRAENKCTMESVQELPMFAPEGANK